MAWLASGSEAVFEEAALSGIFDRLGFGCRLRGVCLDSPVVWAIDVLTAVLLFIVLGWSWFLLPGLLLEAVPGLDVLPFWVLVVGAIAILGSPRPKPK